MRPPLREEGRIKIEPCHLRDRIRNIDVYRSGYKEWYSSSVTVTTVTVFWTCIKNGSWKISIRSSTRQSSWHSTSRPTKKEMVRQYSRRLRWHGYNDHWSNAMDSKQITVEMYRQHQGPLQRASTTSSSQQPQLN